MSCRLRSVAIDRAGRIPVVALRHSRGLRHRWVFVGLSLLRGCLGSGICWFVDLHARNKWIKTSRTKTLIPSSEGCC